MAKEGSVAPKERVNIVYRPATGGAQQEVELPFRLLILGDFSQRPDGRPVEQREPVNVDKNNFNEVLKAQMLELNFAVPNKLTGEGEIATKLKFSNLRDFEPDQIVRQMPELGKLMELRDALKALKGPLGNVPAFRKKLQQLVTDPAAREKVLKELGLDKADKDSKEGK